LIFVLKVVFGISLQLGSGSSSPRNNFYDQNCRGSGLGRQPGPG